MTKVTFASHPYLLGFEQLDRLVERTAKSGSDGYPPCNIAEDAALIQSATRRGRRLTRVPNDDLFVYADTEGMRGASRRDIFLILRDGS